MGKLKLGPLVDDKPVRLTVELPAQVHRDLVAYAEVLGLENVTDTPLEPAKLVGPMLARFMSTDRAFAKARRTTEANNAGITKADLRPEHAGLPGEHG